MRVAIVGLIKAGKSTMMNALLGEAVVATGTVEATFNVNWLKYGETPTLRVIFKDGRPPEPKSFDELAAVTLRADENRDYLLAIKYIEVAYPSGILKTFNLIDTPGLESYYKDDSQNTLDFLSLHGKELTESTQSEASNADAVLYLFSQSLHSADQSVVEQIHGPSLGQPSPINAIGVLTKVDFYWPDSDDPLVAGYKISGRLRSDPRVNRLFYTVVPVAGLMAFGARTLTESDYEILTHLAELPEERFERLIRTVERFGTKDYPDVPVDPPRRKQVLTRLGQFGVNRAVSLIRAGVHGRDDVAEKLYESSGVPQLNRLVSSHFGNRAFVIKLNTSLRQIAAACFREQHRQTGDAREIVEDIAGEFEAIEAQERAFTELRILRNYYEGKLAFDDDSVQQLLEVTGEYGTSCAARLGLGDAATLDDMVKVASDRTREWRYRADDPLVADRQTVHASNVLARAYERILNRVEQARRLLYDI